LITNDIIVIDMAETPITAQNTETQARTPMHVAIIPDGNRRWAKNENKNPWNGHSQGAQNVNDIIRSSYNMNIKYLTFYAFSTENLKNRPRLERNFLYDLFEKKFNELADAVDIHKNQIKVNFFGRINLLPKKVRKAIDNVIEKTKDYSKYFLNFCLAYDGRDELVDAVRKIVKKGISIDDIDRETIKENLYTHDVPAPDLIIRTGMKGGECRLSGYLLWDSSYSEFYFTEKFWPEFGVDEFRSVVMDFAKRDRRFGR
jgi:tritrans,polycis-undecaprenyl-diphosphate synthase [geranylgeranyl-diphosphate specific]